MMMTVHVTLRPDAASPCHSPCWVACHWPRRRGVELNELEIAQDRSDAGCERQSAPYRTQGIGGVRVEPCDPARRQHHGPPRDQDGLMSALGSPRGAEHAGHLTICIECQIKGPMALANLNPWSVPDSLDEGFKETFASSVPIRMNDPPTRVRGFQSQD